MSDLHMHKPCLQHVDPPDLYTADDPVVLLGRQLRAEHLKMLSAQQDGIRALTAEDPAISAAFTAQAVGLYAPGARDDDPATPTFNEATGEFLAVWRTAPDGTPHTVRAS